MKPMAKTINVVLIAIICTLGFTAKELFAMPTVYPTGTTIYNPKECWNGYTIFAAGELGGTVLIDMNGRVVKHWKDLYGYPLPNRILPGGYVTGSTQRRTATAQVFDYSDLVQMDWNGNIVWKFDKAEQVKVGDKMVWSARAHHDWQREGNPVGYYTPGMDPFVDKGNTLMLSTKDVKRPGLTDKSIQSNWIIEVTWDGKIVWDWLLADHYDELGFDEVAKSVLYRLTSDGVWSTNSVDWVGPNKWYDAGDERFNPENIIFYAQRFNVLGIISKKTGKIVWRLGPDFHASPELKKLGWIMGAHKAHIIPKGLPGEGNMMIFDNGGPSGFGNPNPNSVTGFYNAIRCYSRVVEFNPVTLQIVWQYPDSAEGLFSFDNYKFYSYYIGSAQRLPNGNTLIDEGAGGRIFEVTRDRKLVWEYVNPFFDTDPKTRMANPVYRAYRVPYEWVPQLTKPVETAVIPPPPSEFKIAPVGSGQQNPGAIRIY